MMKCQKMLSGVPRKHLCVVSGAEYECESKKGSPES